MSAKNGLKGLLPERVQRVINVYVVVVGLVATLLIGIAVRDFFSPAFYLRKDEWTCSMGHYPLQQDGQAPSPSRGPVHVPQGSWICDRYERKLAVK